jgi:hypothetical protein
MAPYDEPDESIVQLRNLFLYLFNWAPRHEGVFGECMYTSTHSLTLSPDGSGQLHGPAALTPGKEPLLPTG